MQAEYIYSYNRNYVKWKVHIDTEHKIRYQYQIVTTKKLEGLLAADMYATDGEYALYYEISSMQNLKKWFAKEKINKKWMGKLVEGIRTALWSLEQYLLVGKNLLSDPEHIFIHMESERIHFVYFPYYIEEKQQDMEKILSFLIEYADEKEADTVEALYDIYAKWEAGKEQFTWETLATLWDKFAASDTEPDRSAVVSPQPVQFPLREEQEKAEVPVIKKESGKKDITDFLFGRHKLLNKKAYRESVAMENWEYKAEREESKRVEPKREEPAGEASEEPAMAEERKLYGNGKQNRRVLRLESLPAVIGRKESVADIVLDDVSIGIMHARFTEEDGQMYLEDLNTEHGTYKNSVRLKPYEKVEILREDEVRLGRLPFTYR